MLRAIIDEPASDDLRMIFADWLDEHGDAARAEFIRVQCELERKPPNGERGNCHCHAHGILLNEPQLGPLCRHCSLRRRERDLLGKYQGRWTTDMLDQLPTIHRSPLLQLCARDATRVGSWPSDDSMFRFRCGFVAEVSMKLADWCGVDCPRRCRTGPLGIDYFGPCPICHGTGRLGGHGPALVRAAPLELVTLTDAAGILPDQVLRFLPPHNSTQITTAVLSVALLACARSQPVPV